MMKKLIYIFIFFISAVFVILGTAGILIGNHHVIWSIAILVTGIFLTFFTLIKSLSSKIKRNILCIVIALIFCIISVPTFYFYNRVLDVGVVADFNNKLDIWGSQIPGNSKEKKIDRMKINFNGRSLGFSLRFYKAIAGDYRDEEIAIDTFTCIYCIKNGIEKSTFEDSPYLIPYLVNQGKGAVIVVSGGGYGRKSIDGSTAEGKDIALALNQAGINAFVLWYRSNPYEMPIPQLDVQRAVRFIKANADNFGIDKDQVGLLGFSAGGYQVGSFINQIQGKNYFPDGYTLDEIDSIDDSVSVAAMVYPVLTYKYNVPMLFSSFDSDLVKDNNSRETLLKNTDLSLNFNSNQVNQFIAYGNKDSVVNSKGVEEYIDTANSNYTNIEVVKLNLGHAFDQNYYMKEFLSFIHDTWQ